MKRHLLVALMASVVFVPTKSTHAETLIESIQNALDAHPSVSVAMAVKDIAREDFKAARSGLFPQVSAGYTGGRVYGDTATSRGLTVNRGAAYSWLGEGNAAITQPLFDGFDALNRMSAARARTESADFDILDAQESLAFRAAQAHLAVLQAQDTLDKTQSYYEVIEDYLDRIQFMVDEGVADESEAAQAKNISLMLKSTLTDYEGQLNAALARYQEVTGTSPQSKLIKPKVLENIINEDVSQALDFAQKNHPMVKAGQKKLEAAKHDIKVERSGFFPEVDGEVSYLKRDQKEEIGGEVVDSRAVVKMSWDFEVGGGQLARTKKAKAQYSEILAQNQEVALTIDSDIRRAYAEFDTAKKQMELVQKRELVTQDLFDAYETQFEGARVRLLQLMQAENQLFNAQLESITAEYRYIMAHYGVLASSGQLLEFIKGSDFIDRPAIQAAEEIEINEHVAMELSAVPEEDVDIVLEENIIVEEDVAVIVGEVSEPEKATAIIEITEPTIEQKPEQRISIDPLLDNQSRPVRDDKVKVSSSISKETDVEILDNVIEESFSSQSPQVIPNYKLPERIILQKTK